MRLLLFFSGKPEGDEGGFSAGLRDALLAFRKLLTVREEGCPSLPPLFSNGFDFCFSFMISLRNTARE
jgi:hypothetical protein